MEDKDENGSTGKSGHLCNLSRVRPIGHIIQNLRTIRTQQDRIGNKVVAPSSFGKPGHQVKGHTLFHLQVGIELWRKPVTRGLPARDDGKPMPTRYSQ